MLFAKADGNPRTGLKSMISGPFFIGRLVGVGCGLMVLGLGLGTLAGTLEPTPMCALWAHILDVGGGEDGSLMSEVNLIDGFGNAIHEGRPSTRPTVLILARIGQI
jgi:hypothetical protein